MEQLISNIRNIDVVELLLESINESEKEVRELLNDQMDKGKRGDGKSITPLYSKQYAKKKGRKIPDLKLEGDYRKNIYTEIGNYDVVTVKSTRVSKGFDVAEYIEDRYTSKVLELNDESVKKLQPVVNKKFFKKLQDEIYR